MARIVAFCYAKQRIYAYSAYAGKRVSLALYIHGEFGKAAAFTTCGTYCILKPFRNIGQGGNIAWAEPAQRIYSGLRQGFNVHYTQISDCAVYTLRNGVAYGAGIAAQKCCADCGRAHAAAFGFGRIVLRTRAHYGHGNNGGIQLGYGAYVFNAQYVICAGQNAGVIFAKRCA